jgi:enolase
MPKIKSISAREILDSRGNPTIETRINLSDGRSVKAAVPSGASTGAHEAWELRDADKARYGGLGVLKAVDNVNKKIAKALVGKDPRRQKEVDETMIDLDGTDNKSALGANAILSVSLACARAGALSEKMELFEWLAGLFSGQDRKYSLPTPCFNIFNGGKHADTNLDFQEFMIVPLANTPFSPEKHRSRQSLKEQVRMGAEIFHELGNVLKRGGYDTDIGNEGGYAPDIISSIQALEFITAACVKAGYRPGNDVGFGIDVGSSELYNRKSKKYVFRLDQAQFTSNTLIGLYYEWFRKYPIVSIEDGIAEDDWEGWRELTKELGAEMMLVGDDLFVTNPARLRLGLKHKAANAILVKVNQIGTLWETLECVRLAQRHHYCVMVSHRSGETCDDFIADLAVAVGSEYIKAGSLSRGERLAKYNRLMEIEDLLEV